MTERTIWLDRLSDADIPPESLVIDSETDFLKFATEPKSLVVRGQSLCDWAAEFARGRGVSIHTAISPTRAIQSVVPNITLEQAQEIVERLGDQRGITQRPGFSPTRLLVALYPQSLWAAIPSRQHAAEWLLWLYHERPSVAVQVVLKSHIIDWQNASSEPERSLYTAVSFETARARLHDWLLIKPKPELTNLGEFPEIIPEGLIAEARQHWKNHIIHTQGGFFDELSQQPVPARLVRLAAEETADYFLENPQHLTAIRLTTLAPFLDTSRRLELTKFIPPDPPGPLPKMIPDVLTWFEKKYLPYRLWQSERGREAEAIVAQEAANQFANWYLHSYPKAFASGPIQEYLSFRQPLPLHADQTASTLVVILDGLHAEDAKVLRQKLAEAAPRLNFLEAKWVFAPLPTVTEIAKPTLFTGLAPMDAGGYGNRAEIIPEKEQPAKRMAQAEAGQLFFWRIMDPDDTYHRENHKDSLRIEVEAAIGKIASLIADVVRKVPREVPLRVVVTTDHGRLLGKALRSVPVPRGMKGHGRAAWGERQHDFEDDGFIIKGDVAYLHGQRFGLSSEVGEVAVVIGPHMFKTNDSKAGSEAFPHGGVSPEEVIIPWWVLERDWQPPVVMVTVSGSGMAGTQARVSIDAMNPGDVGVTLTTIRLTWPDGSVKTLEVGLDIRPRSKALSVIELNPWPTPDEAGRLTAVAALRLSAGRRFDVDAAVGLTSEEMYGREDILSDLP